MTLKSKLSLLCGIPLAGLIVSVAVSSSMARMTQRGVTQAKDESAVYAALAQEMKLQVVQVQQWLTDISATRGQNGLADGFDKAEASRTAFFAALKSFEAMYQSEGDTEGLARLASVRHAFDAYYEAGRTMAQTYVREGTSAGNAGMAAFDQTAEKLSATLGPLVEEQTAELQESLAAVGRANALSILVLTGGGILLALATIVLGVLMIRSISRSITASVEVLSAGAEQVTAASAQVSVSAQSLSQGATEQAASLEETSASMEEMAAMTRQNAEHAYEAATLMAQVAGQVANSNHLLEGMVRSMGSIQDSSVRVSKIIKTIDEIAFQTNILALNAAVEAARAGESGMGFAVVADEVRNLAQRSAQAAKDTATLIEESSANAQQGGQQVGQVAAAINEITGSITRVKTLVDDVTAASRQQSQGLDQASQAVAQMEKVTQTTAATAEETAAASEELSAQAETTMGAVRELAAMVDGGAGAAQVHAQPSRRAAGHGVAKVLTLARKAGTTASPRGTTAEKSIPFGDTGTFGQF